MIARLVGGLGCVLFGHGPTAHVAGTKGEVQRVCAFCGGRVTRRSHQLRATVMDAFAWLSVGYLLYLALGHLSR